MKTLLLLWFSAWFSNITVAQYVDDIEPLLRANRDAYLGGPHTVQRRDHRLLRSGMGVAELVPGLWQSSAWIGWPAVYC